MVKLRGDIVNGLANQGAGFAVQAVAEVCSIFAVWRWRVMFSMSRMVALKMGRIVAGF